VTLFAEVGGSEAEPAGYRAAKIAFVHHSNFPMYGAHFTSTSALATHVDRINRIIILLAIHVSTIERSTTLVASKDFSKKSYRIQSCISLQVGANMTVGFKYEELGYDNIP
jgi:hypothetical protein